MGHHCGSGAGSGLLPCQPPSVVPRDGGAGQRNRAAGRRHLGGGVAHTRPRRAERRPRLLGGTPGGYAGGEQRGGLRGHRARAFHPAPAHRRRQRHRRIRLCAGGAPQRRFAVPRGAGGVPHLGRTPAGRGPTARGAALGRGQGAHRGTFRAHQPHHGRVHWLFGLGREDRRVPKLGPHRHRRSPFDGQDGAGGEHRRARRDAHGGRRRRGVVVLPRAIRGATGGAAPFSGGAHRPDAHAQRPDA